MRKKRKAEGEKRKKASDPKTKSCWVYVLECGDGSYYTGWTNDLAKRVRMRAEAERSRERSRKAKRSKITKREMTEGKRRRAKIKQGRANWIRWS